MLIFKQESAIKYEKNLKYVVLKKHNFIFLTISLQRNKIFCHKLLESKQVSDRSDLSNSGFGFSI